MTKMKLAVPRDAQLLLYSKEKLRRQHALLLQVLRDNADIRVKIEDFSQPLFSTSLKKVCSTPAAVSLSHTICDRSHPEMVGDMSRVTLNFDLSKIPFVHF